MELSPWEYSDSSRASAEGTLEKHPGLGLVGILFSLAPTIIDIDVGCLSTTTPTLRAYASSSGGLAGGVGF